MEKSIFIKQTGSTSMQDGMWSKSETSYFDTYGLPRETISYGSGNTVGTSCTNPNDPTTCEKKRQYVTYAFEAYPAMATKHMYSQPYETMAGDANTNFASKTGLKAYAKTEYVTTADQRIYPYKQYAWEDKDMNGAINPSTELIAASEVVAYGGRPMFDNFGHALTVQDAKLVKTKTFYGDNNECDDTSTILKSALPTCVKVDAAAANPQTSTVSYGAMGNVLTMTDANLRTTTYLYDALWRLKKAFQQGDTPDTNQLCTYAGYSVCYDYSYALDQPLGRLAYNVANLAYPSTNLNKVTTTTRINNIGQPTMNSVSSGYADGLGKPYVETVKNTEQKDVAKVTEYNAVMLPFKQSEPYIIGQTTMKSTMLYEASPLMRAVKTYPLNAYPNGAYSSNDIVTNKRWNTATFGYNSFGASRVVDPSGAGASSVVDRFGRSVESVANNLVVNPGFELGIEFWSLCKTDADTNPSNDDVTSCIVSSGCYSGSKCLKGFKDEYAVKQYGEISLKPNTDYKLSFWGKSGTTGTIPKVRLNFDTLITRGAYSYDASVSDDRPSDGVSLHCNVMPTSSWRQDYCIFNSGANTHMNWVGAWGLKTGGVVTDYVLIDDIQIAPATGAMDFVRTKTTYNDVMGLSVDVTNPSNQVTNSRADALGRVRVTQNPDFGTRRNLNYDIAGNVIVSGDGCALYSYTTGYTWDGTTARLDVLCPVSGRRLIGYAYDNLNRLRCIKYGFTTSADAVAWTGIFTGTCPAGSQVKYTYDGYSGTCTADGYADFTGRLTMVEDSYQKASPYINCYYYDNRGRIKKEKRYIDGAIVGDGIEYNYDNAGNLLKLDYPNTDYAEYEYNVLNQLKKVKLNGNELATYNYRDDGLVLTQTYTRVC
jgi:hypothetical protein